ncbi:MAG TPA: lipid-transfer protein, partial [Acidimicrobiales bacterium]|nr:lipid-transfer protein [Acidimicrobiales bacterium]
MRDVAIVSFVQSKAVRSANDCNEVEMLMPVVSEVVAKSGIPKKEIGFTISGSCDYLGGVPFAFVSGLDAVGAWPPISESHVEMDGAWAFYEAWVRLQHGDIDSALVYCFGKSSLGDVPDILSQQLDPYYLAPLWPDTVSVAALQARAWLDAGHSEEEMAEVVATSR